MPKDKVVTTFYPIYLCKHCNQTYSGVRVDDIYEHFLDKYDRIHTCPDGNRGVAEVLYFKSVEAMEISRKYEWGVNFRHKHPVTKENLPVRLEDADI